MQSATSMARCNCLFGTPAFHPAIDGRLVYGESPGRLRHVTTGLEEGLADDRVLSPSEALPERAFRPRTRAATDMRGEVFGTNLTARHGDGPPGAQILQLSDVPGPVKGREKIRCLAGEGKRLPPKLGALPVQEHG